MLNANLSLILASSHIQPWKPEEVVTLMSSTRLHPPGTLDNRLHISTLYTVKFSVHCKFLHFTLYHLLYNVHLYINTAQFTVHSKFVPHTLYHFLYTHLYIIPSAIYCTLHICTVYTVQFTVQCIFVQYTLYSLLYTAHLYISHCKIYCTLHICELYTVQFIAYCTYVHYTMYKLFFHPGS